MENFKLFLQIYYQPAAAMSNIIDRGSWVFAAIQVLLISAGFFLTINAKLDEAYRVPEFNEYLNDRVYELADDQLDTAVRSAQSQLDTANANRPRIPFVGDTFFSFFTFSPTTFYQPFLSITLFYVPLVILLVCLVGGVGNFGIVLRREYTALATCVLMAWAAGNFPFVIAGILTLNAAVSPAIYLAMWLGSGLLFGVFVLFAIRTVFGVSFGVAAVPVLFSWLSFAVGMYVFQYVSPWLFSPFLILFAVMYFGGYLGNELRGFGDTFRRRQNFNRYLHSATVNPKDADAHVQLGLIYLQRRQDAKAIDHFRKAFEIDPTEIDANYHLGRIDRQNGDLQQALDHFAVVVEQDDKYSLNEIWREIGETYMAAKMPGEALNALEKYVARRPVDPEGLYYFGKVLAETGQTERAKEMFEQAIESVRIAPSYRQHELRKWSKLAEKEL
jgi:Tfp pilus assembly protein PilF